MSNEVKLEYTPMGRKEHRMYENAHWRPSKGSEYGLKPIRGPYNAGAWYMMAPLCGHHLKCNFRQKKILQRRGKISKKAYFNQQTGFASPVHWSKYTTLETFNSSHYQAGQRWLCEGPKYFYFLSLYWPGVRLKTIKLELVS